MILHLFKLVWNRKMTNLLIVAEIFCSFLVVFALAASAFFLYDRYRDPLGYEYRDVWQIEVDRNVAGGWNDWSPEESATFRRLLQEVTAMDEVEVAAGANTAPYKSSVHTTGWDWNNRTVHAEVSYVTPGFIDVLGLELLEGRWLTEDDSALDYAPIVVDLDLARDLVGDGDLIGMKVSDEHDVRVVGVVREYRRGGEFYENGNYILRSAKIETDEGRPLRMLLVKVAPGTQADFEEPLVRKLRAVAHGWSFNVTQLEAAREWNLKQRLMPIAAMGVVACFLLAMVVLGLTGVMWQNVTRRTREIGLRRAAGADRRHIHRQIVGEVMITASLGLVAGAFIAVQVPVLGPFTFVPYAVVIPALIAAALFILVLSAVCGVYPGWSATRIHPAEALHYE